MWCRREIENYICTKEALISYSEDFPHETDPKPNGPLFEVGERERRKKIMQECIEGLVPGFALQDPLDPWWKNTKASDDFLDRLFDIFFKKLGIPNLMRKTDYHILTGYVSKDQIDPEVSMVLNDILEVAKKAKPIQEDI